jgi:hypothetical protein
MAIYPRQSEAKEAIPKKGSQWIKVVSRPPETLAHLPRQIVSWVSRG